jgi:hypothetical protein
VPIIDLHTHVFPDTLASGALATLSAQGEIRPYYDGTVDGLIAAMDRAGIDRSVVAPVATKPSQVRSINDWVAGVPRERIVPLGALHPDMPDPASELDRLLSLGVTGIKLHSQHQRFLPNDPRMRPIYEAVIEREMLVLFHAGGYVGEHEVENRPHEFAEVLDAYPELRCVLAHMGGYLQWDEVREHLCGRDVYLDTAYVPRNLPDDAFIALARDHGIERICFGSDGPWTDAAAEIEYLKAIGFTPAELDAILWGNAVRLLGSLGAARVG